MLKAIRYATMGGEGSTYTWREIPNEDPIDHKKKGRNGQSADCRTSAGPLCSSRESLPYMITPTDPSVAQVDQTKRTWSNHVNSSGCERGGRPMKRAKRNASHVTHLLHADIEVTAANFLGWTGRLDSHLFISCHLAIVDLALYLAHTRAAQHRGTIVDQP